MPLSVQEINREFVFDDVTLPDPNQELPPEKVREFYTPQYPALATATLVGPEQFGDRMRYRFQRAVGAKG